MQYSEEVLALAQYLKIDPSDVQEERDTYTAEGGEYMVLTDDEADAKWEESLESYIEDCILPELPEAYRFYFDDEKWMRDAKMDGRGHSLASYDGEEGEETVQGEGMTEKTTYYIYRTN